MQDAVIHSGMPSRTFYYLADKHEVLQHIKKDINDVIIAKINRGALKGEFNATASIWRQKQLGEKDQQYTENTTKSKVKIVCADEETKDKLNNIIDEAE